MTKRTLKYLETAIANKAFAKEIATKLAAPAALTKKCYKALVIALASDKVGLEIAKIIAAKSDAAAADAAIATAQAAKTAADTALAADPTNTTLQANDTAAAAALTAAQAAKTAKLLLIKAPTKNAKETIKIMLTDKKAAAELIALLAP
jgi:hypothetical protein